MNLKQFYRYITVFLLTVFVFSGCGSSGGVQTINEKKIGQLEVLNNIDLISESNKSQVFEYKVTDANKTSLIVSEQISDDLEVGKVFHIEADDNRFPFGLTGKIESINQKNGKSELIFSKAELSDFASEIHVPAQSKKLNSTNFIGVIAPNSVHAITNSSNTKNKFNVYNKNTKSFLNGGVIFTPYSSTSIQQKSFLGESGEVTAGDIKLNLEIDLNDLKEKGSKSKGNSAKTEAKVILSGSLSNLKLYEYHDISFVDRTVALDIKTSGDLTTELKFTGEASALFGVHNRAWKEVEKSAFDKFGIDTDLTGLGGDDKIGKYPIVGLVFQSITPVTYTGGRTQTPIRQAKVGGMIVWVYINALGKLSFKGEFGTRTNAKFSVGVSKKKGESLVFSNSLTALPNKRLIEAPFINGEVGVGVEAGVSIAVDTFLAGIRVATAGMDAGFKGDVKVKTQKDLSYGTNNLNDAWSWEGGKICLESKYGAGAIFNANVKIGMNLDAGLFKTNGNFEYALQYPTKEDLDAKKDRGRVGSWYNLGYYDGCFNNHKPIANSLIVVTQKNITKNLTLSASDEDDDDDDDIAFIITQQPKHGRLSGTIPNLVYTPNTEYVGEDTFYFQVNDGMDNSSISKVIITINDKPEPPISTISLNIGNDLIIQEQKTKVISFTISDKDNKISKVGCSATPNGITLSNTNKKVTITAPSYNVLKAFTVKCVARDDKLKVLDSDELTVTVTKKSVIEIINVTPIVTLPTSLGVNNKVVPIEEDDKGIVRHEWLVSWSGAKKSQASPLSASTNTITLNVPTLDPGESLSATVTLTVYDEEGEKATATQTYNYRVKKVEAIKFISDNFDDGIVIPRGTTKKHLEWRVKNISNVDLKDVVLKLNQKANKLTVTDIEPSTIATWKKGETKTFSVDVTVPNDITEGTHKQLWNFYYNTNKALPYEGKIASAPIFFEFKTTNPNELIGRLITDKKLVTPNETITSLLEVTSGNAPYKVEVDWGDSKNETFKNIAKNITEGMTKSLTHSYASNGNYHITVKVTDNANKKATLTDIIKVESSTTKTLWTADVHDINTDERASNIAITVNTVDGHGQYHTNWTPTKDTQSKEYFVKYRLPIPSKLLMLNKKMRVTVDGLSSDIEAYDREINFKTSDSKEYTASIRHKDFEETLANGTTIKGGYFTTKDLSTGVISKEEAEFLNSEYIPLDGVYAMGTTPSNKLNVYSYDGDYTNLFPKTINLSGNWLTELDVTFKGNGVVKFVVIEYDLNGDDEFSSDEKLVLSTVDKEVDWSGFRLNDEKYGTYTQDGKRIIITGGKANLDQSSTPNFQFNLKHDIGNNKDVVQITTNFHTKEAFDTAFGSNNSMLISFDNGKIQNIGMELAGQGWIGNEHVSSGYSATVLNNSDGTYNLTSTGSFISNSRTISAINAKNIMFKGSTGEDGTLSNLIIGKTFYSKCGTTVDTIIFQTNGKLKVIENGGDFFYDNYTISGNILTTEDDEDGTETHVFKDSSSEYVRFTESNGDITTLYFNKNDAQNTPDNDDCGGDDYDHNGKLVTDLVSGHIIFKEDGQNISVPSDAWIRIVPKVYQNGNKWYGPKCKIDSSGNFGNQCYVHYDLDRVKNSFTSSEKYQVVIYKETTGNRYWDKEESTYFHLGESVDYNGWKNFTIEDESQNDDSDREVDNNENSNNDNDVTSPASISNFRLEEVGEGDGKIKATYRISSGSSLSNVKLNCSEDYNVGRSSRYNYKSTTGSTRIGSGSIILSNSDWLGEKVYCKLEVWTPKARPSISYSNISNISLKNKTAGIPTSAPRLSRPSNNSRITDTTPKLDWSSVDKADHYKIYLYGAYDGSRELTGRYTSRSYYNMPSSDRLEQGKTYEWYVKACNANRECGPISQKYRFTVR